VDELTARRTALIGEVVTPSASAVLFTSVAWLNQTRVEELRDNLYKEVATRRAEGNAFSMQQTVENVCAFLYNNAFSTTYFTTGDGAALCSTAHIGTLGGTYSNALSPAADLSEASLEDLTIQIMGTQNDSGLLINIMPESLHIARNEWYNANRILQSVLQSNTASNNIHEPLQPNRIELRILTIRVEYNYLSVSRRRIEGGHQSVPRSS